MEHYLGEKLKKLRESRGWTQADLAKRLNKAVSTISGYVICGHTDFVTSFLYFDTKSWTLIAYCALMLSIVNLRIKVDVTISCLLFLHERVIPMQS